MQEKELAYVYENEGALIFPEMYEAYNSVFLAVLLPFLDKSFSSLSNTQLNERFLLNTAQFSASKNYSEVKLLRELIFDKKGNKKSFSQFKKEAAPVLKEFNQNWLRVEYELAARSAVMADRWQNIYNNRKNNPYFKYVTRHDERVRDEHRALDGRIFAIDSPAGQNIFPPCGWNCRCTAEPVNTGTPETEAQAQKLLEKNVPEQFRYNPGINGLFPKDSSYFKVLANANKVNYAMFASEPRIYTTLNTYLYDTVQLAKKLESWKNTDKDEIIFRNQKYKLNVFLNSTKSLKLRGIENVKETIEKPSEIWFYWLDTEEQKEVHLNFILKSKDGAYIVEVEKGVIKDAYLLGSQASINKRRTGVRL